MGIAPTFQITGVFSKLTCYDTVELAAQRTLLTSTSGRLNPEHLRVGTLRAPARVDLEQRAATLAKNLSYSHQRLPEVAMGLALKPRLLMLDEPTQGLSSGEIDYIVALIRELASNNGILSIEHNMHVIMQLAEQITVFGAGEILAEGPPEDIQANRAVQRAYLGNSG